MKNKVESSGRVEVVIADLAVIHECDDLLVVAKPAGIAVIPGRGEGAETCLRHAAEATLAARGEPSRRLWVVHRLDRDVSGVLVFARTAAAHRRVSMAFERGEVEKSYWALVDGAPDKDTGLIDLPLRTGAHAGRTVVDPKHGKPARTRFRVRERFRRFAVLEVEPETGRTHQIRVHLASIGHPVAGDAAYGGTRTPPSRAAGVREALLSLRRPALHAARLVFDHPATGDRVRFESPLPDDLLRLVERLREYH